MVAFSPFIDAFQERRGDVLGAVERKCAELGINYSVLAELLPVSILPYHNRAHMINVAFDAEKLAFLTGYDVFDRRNIFIAGLFHDVNHTGLAKPDILNIEKVKAFFVENESVFSELGFNLWVDVFPLIEATNTDLTSFEAVTYLGKLLKDADLLAWTYEDFDKLASGLGDEFGIGVSLDSTRLFMSEVPVFSSYALSALVESGFVPRSKKLSF